MISGEVMARKIFARLEEMELKRLILINRETVNQRVSFYRQRFSLAHEIGHVAMNHPPMAFLGDVVIEDRDPRHEV